MEEGRDWGRETERTGRVRRDGGAGNGKAIKPQNATGLAFGDAPWGYRPMSYIFRKLFSGTFQSHTVCLYLEPFKSNRASKLTILKKSLKNFHRQHVPRRYSMPLSSTVKKL